MSTGAVPRFDHSSCSASAADPTQAHQAHLVLMSMMPKVRQKPRICRHREDGEAEARAILPRLLMSQRLRCSSKLP